MHFINETKELTFWHLSLLQSCSKLVLSNFLELPRIKMDRSKKMSKELKIAFVKEVLERKDVLFAKFSTQITSADKTNSWTYALRSSPKASIMCHQSINCEIINGKICKPELKQNSTSLERRAAEESNLQRFVMLKVFVRVSKDAYLAREFGS